MSVSFDTTGAKGRVSKTFEIKTNDPEKPSIVLVLYGVVEE